MSLDALMSSPVMKLRERAGWLIVVLFLTVGGSSGTAGATDADKLIREGLDLRRGGDDAGALQKFQRAFELAPSPRATAQMGLAEQALGRWVMAYEHLQKALGSTNDAWIKKSRPALDEALNHVNDHVGQVEILGGSPGAEVRIDGSPRGKLPLTHAIVVSTGTVTIDLVAPGFVAIQHTTIVHARESIRESFDALALLPARGGAPSAGIVKASAVTSPRARPASETVPNSSLSAVADPLDGSPASGLPDASTDTDKDSRDDSGKEGGFRTKAKWVAWGVGAAALGVGAFGWVRQNQAGNDFASGCRTDPVQSVVAAPGSSKSVDDCRDLKTKVDSNFRIELVGLVGAGVLAATGLVLWLTEPAATASDTTALSCRPELTVALAPRLSCRLSF